MKFKDVLIAAIVATVIGLSCMFLFLSVQNTAISLEESVIASDSSIKVVEKRRADLILNLVDTAVTYSEFEGGTVREIADLRTSENAGAVLNAVAENYPVLKSIDLFTNTMQELTLTENTIADYRESYNANVRAYNRYVRSFPGQYILSFVGYVVVPFEYKDYGASESAPTNLYGDN